MNKYLQSNKTIIIQKTQFHTLSVPTLVGNLGLRYRAYSEPQATAWHAHVSTLYHTDTLSSVSQVKAGEEEKCR